jgi:hypothetical protein
VCGVINTRQELYLRRRRPKKLFTALGDFSASRILEQYLLLTSHRICILIFILITMPYYDVTQRSAAINGYSNAQITKQTGIPPRTVINLLDKAI